ncbi:TPA: outer membrane lipid asymmetry maintenance protein MlaD [Candidatus Sumerlaeota bacterium]|jgi:phospholipid/cholesterol/gamma-HCH transport system substrate-binding protein|nr:outer membrane lipid asymmetry maintenance protein MlaD [Candidatus Sumerlaeota bacterium]
MKNLKLEISVGVFVLLGLCCVAYLTIKLGKMEWVGGGKYYTVTANFRSVSGLKSHAQIELCGVQIGQVQSITLDCESMQATVKLRIRTGIPLTDDSIASVKTSGLIGDKFIKISPGGSTTPLKDGDRITETESSVDLEEMLSKYAFGKV